MEADEWHLSGFRFRLGRSSMHGEFARTGIGAKPLITAKLEVDQIDVPELEAIRPPPTRNPPRRGAPTRAPRSICRFFPPASTLSDADVDVQVKRVVVQPADVTDASFNGRIRDGRMWPSPFSAKIAGVPFSGAMALDLRGQVPEASVWVAAEKVDVGGLLRSSSSCRTSTRAWSCCAPS